MKLWNCPLIFRHYIPRCLLFEREINHHVSQTGVFLFLWTKKYHLCQILQEKANGKSQERSSTCPLPLWILVWHRKTSLICFPTQECLQSWRVCNYFVVHFSESLSYLWTQTLCGRLSGQLVTTGKVGSWDVNGRKAKKKKKKAVTFQLC